MSMKIGFVIFVFSFGGDGRLMIGGGDSFSF